METYETFEGIIYCSNCGTALTDNEIKNEVCNYCEQLEDSSYMEQARKLARNEIQIIKAKRN